LGGIEWILGGFCGGRGGFGLKEGGGDLGKGGVCGWHWGWEFGDGMVGGGNVGFEATASERTGKGGPEPRAGHSTQGRGGHDGPSQFIPRRKEM